MESSSPAPATPALPEPLALPRRAVDVPRWLLRMTVLPLPPLRSPIDGRPLREARERNAIYQAFAERRRHARGAKKVGVLFGEVAPHLQGLAAFLVSLAMVRMLGVWGFLVMAMMVPVLLIFAVMRRSGFGAGGASLPHSASSALGESVTRVSLAEDLWLASSAQELGEAVLLDHLRYGVPTWLITGLAGIILAVLLWAFSWQFGTTGLPVAAALAALFTLMRTWRALMESSVLLGLRNERLIVIRRFPIPGVTLSAVLVRLLRQVVVAVGWLAVLAAVVALFALIAVFINLWLSILLVLLALNASVTASIARTQAFLDAFVRESALFYGPFFRGMLFGDPDAFDGLTLQAGEYPDGAPSLQRVEP